MGLRRARCAVLDRDLGVGPSRALALAERQGRATETGARSTDRARRRSTERRRSTDRDATMAMMRFTKNGELVMPGQSTTEAAAPAALAAPATLPRSEEVFAMFQNVPSGMTVRMPVRGRRESSQYVGDTRPVPHQRENVEALMVPGSRRADGVHSTALAAARTSVAHERPPVAKLRFFHVCTDVTCMQ